MCVRVCMCARIGPTTIVRLTGTVLIHFLSKGAENKTHPGERSLQSETEQTSGLTERQRWMDIHRRMDRGSLN